MINNNPIGFFDSGVGGLSVYARFRSLLPAENTIYYGDLKNMPYGNKTKDELVGFARRILDFFEAQNVKAVVIACNTSSAVAYNDIKGSYSFKVYPIIQSCARVVSSMPFEKVGVFATSATINSNAYKAELIKYNENLTVIQEACPNWTNIVESGKIESDFADRDVRCHLGNMLKQKPDKIILGCTHYPYLLRVLTKYAPEDMFIDPAEIFVKYIKNDLEKSCMLNTGGGVGTENFYVSAKPLEFVNNAKIFYNVANIPVTI